MGSPDVEILHHVRTGEVRGVSLSNQEGFRSQDSVGSSCLMAEAGAAMTTAKAVWLLHAYTMSCGWVRLSHAPFKRRVSWVSVILKCC